MTNSAVSSLSTPSSIMVEFLRSRTLDNLPPEIIAQARIRLLDTLGCGLYGSTMPWSRIAADVVYEEQSQGRASVFGHRNAIAPARAALVNGTAAHGMELDDIAAPGTTHPGSVVVPAVLAIAQQFELPGIHVLLGVIAGYEATTRVSSGIGKAYLGFHIPAIAGAVGAAVGSGVALGLPHQQIMWAAGIACSSASGIRSFVQGTGGMIKRMHAGRAAESGVLACMLARRGFTAPLAAMDGKFGLLEVFGGKNANPQALDDRLGESYTVSDVWTKMYPFCGAMHCMAQALHTLRMKHGIVEGAAISKIRLGVNQRATEVHTEVRPRETMAAQYSMPFTAATALLGDPRDPRSFVGAALDNTAVCALAQRVELYLEPAMESTEFPRNIGSAHVQILLTDGRKLEATADHAHGMPNEPCTEDEIREKFSRLAGAAITEDAVARITELVGRMETLPSVAPLTDVLCAGMRK